MAVALALTTLLALLLQNVQKTELINRTGQTFEKGVVTEVLVDNLQPDGTRVGEQRVAVRMTTGVRKGQVIEMTSSAGYLFGATCTPGLRVIVMQSVCRRYDGLERLLAGPRRGAAAAFCCAVPRHALSQSGKQGLKGALGLAFTFLAIIFLYLPLVYLGWPPLWTSVLICAVTTAVTMYFIGGPTRKTVVASAGTVAGVVIAGFVAAIFGAGNRYIGVERFGY